MNKLVRLLVGIAVMVGLIGAVGATEPLAQPAAAASYVSAAYTAPKRGQTNAGVKSLQLRLVKANLLSRDSVTSYFGPLTEGAVKRFQRAQGLSANGKVDKTTWLRLVKQTGKITIAAQPKTKLAQRCLTSGRVLCIDKTRRQLFYVQNGRIVKSMSARFGCAGNRTREGTFSILRKNRHWVSTIYHSPMPFSMFFSGGQAVHYSSDFAARGYSGCSHGCVNIRDWNKLEYVFAHARVGDRVVVYRS